MKNDIEKKIDVLDSIGKDLIANKVSLTSAIEDSLMHNRWFTKASIEVALTEIAQNYLKTEELIGWTSGYSLGPRQPRKIGMVLAGNIPLVGFHDVLCVLLSGHKGLIKISDKDKFLLPALISIYEERIAEKSNLEFVERLKGFDAIIATGSNNTGRYFEEYFSHVPHIIRRNRNGVAVLNGEESIEDLQNLGRDIFSYFGLGCRNVSKIYVPRDYDFNKFFESIAEFDYVINHNKYKNNFDYYYSIALLNQEKFLTNDFLLLKELNAISSPISVLNYEFYDDISRLECDLSQTNDQIQLVISLDPIPSFKHYRLGDSQKPSLTDYADGIDTMEFLLNLGT